MLMELFDELLEFEPSIKVQSPRQELRFIADAGLVTFDPQAQPMMAGLIDVQIERHSLGEQALREIDRVADGNDLVVARGPKETGRGFLCDLQLIG